MNEAFSKYVKRPEILERLLERSILLSYFTPIQHSRQVEVTDDPVDGIWSADVIKFNGTRMGDIVEVVSPKARYLAMIGDDTKLWMIKVSDGSTVFDIYDKITLKEGDIANYKGPETTTSIGQFLTNYILGASVFGDRLPYVNGVWKIGDNEDKIATGLIAGTITMDEYKKYIDHGYFLGHMAEIAVPTITERSFTTDPKIRIRKEELLKQYAGQLNDPLILEKIENELLKMDRDYLAGDDSLGFHLASNPNKSLGIHRKKLFVSVGGIEEFSDGSPAFINIKNSLSEGWDKENFDVVANEIRKGSYSRGKETAKGGSATKFVLRVFQDLIISAYDCGTKRTWNVLISKYETSQFVGRTAIIDGIAQIMTKDMLDQMVGKVLNLRSPLYCAETAGLCNICCGETVRRLGVSAIGVLSVDITSTMMLLSMKAMHGTKISVKRINFKDHLRAVDKKKLLSKAVGDSDAIDEE